MIGNEWPEHDVQKLMELAKEELSAKQIGLIMGRPRNAIIGKLRRLGVPLFAAKTEPRAPRRMRVTVPGNIVARRPLMDRKQPPQEQPDRRPGRLRPRRWDYPSKEPIVPVNGGAGISLLELKRDKCHSVVGSTRPQHGLPHYCGHPAWNNTYYCEDHFAVFHQPPRPR